MYNGEVKALQSSPSTTPDAFVQFVQLFCWYYHFEAVFVCWFPGQLLKCGGMRAMNRLVNLRVVPVLATAGVTSLHSAPVQCAEGTVT